MKALNLTDVLGVSGLSGYLRRVEAVLTEQISAGAPTLNAPALRLMDSGGKRLRPALVIAAASVGAGARIGSPVIRAGAAVELAHLGTLIHDDIIDGGQTRRGVPTINHQEGPSAALLVGDYLLALAAGQAAAVSAEAAGIMAGTVAAMCEGQSRELADCFNLDRSVDSYLVAVQGKTAALLAAAMRLGGLCGGLPAGQIEALARYGEDFGLAFQLLDDVLDVLADAAVWDKTPAGDAAAGVYTLPVLLALRGPSAAAVRGLLAARPPDAPALRRVLLAAGSVRQAMERAQGYADSATRALERLPAGPVKQGLERLPGAYIDWAKQLLRASVPDDAYDMI